MVKQVLSFARGNAGKRVVFQPQHVLADLFRILREILPKSIEVQLDIPRNLGAINADPTQVNQVLMNLCVNARDAMPNGGRLTIRADNTTLDANYSQMKPEAHAGDFVEIVVCDTGTGMKPEVIARIFDPFFTTKEMGRGTGLGLSSALSIVKSHDGFIDVKSQLGKGTEIAVYFPVSTDLEEPPHAVDEAELLCGHGELVLVVDDEESIRQITKSTLETFGYRVLTASDGTEALAQYATNRSVAVVLMDLVMPFMDGVAAIRALRRLDPALKIICTSGLSDDTRAVTITRAEANAFLTKPYTAKQLLNALAQVL